MATQQQILANRETARASTGPKSFAGKLASSRNATRHGLTASSIDHTLNSPVVVPPAAPVARMLNSSTYRTSADNVALRLTFVEQARLSREQNQPVPGDPSPESSLR